jgi:hypothetical protein
MSFMRSAASALVVARAQQHDKRLVVLAAREEVGHQPLAQLRRRHVGQVGEPQVELCRRGEQLLLVADVAHHHRRIDVGIRRDGTVPSATKWSETLIGVAIGLEIASS